MTQDDYNKSLLALTLWREARGEGPDGMQAVASVIKNRVSAGYGNWNRVMTAKWQFSSLTATGDPELTQWPTPDDAAWKNAMVISEGVYSGHLPDNTSGATHYYAVSIPEPSWAAKMTFIVQIAHQRFYK